MRKIKVEIPLSFVEPPLSHAEVVDTEMDMWASLSIPAFMFSHTNSNPIISRDDIFMLL